MKQSYEAFQEGRQVRRMKAEDRFLAKMEKQVKDAEKIIGEVVRNGKVVYYVFPVGGRYRESSNFFELVGFLVRNRYI